MLAQLNTKVYNHPIYYASSQLILVEMNYTSTEQEGLNIIYVLKIFCHYLLETMITVVIDHQAFIYLLNKPNVTKRIAGWIIDLKIIRCTSTKHDNVDFLSRTEKEMDVVFEYKDFPTQC